MIIDSIHVQPDPVLKIGKAFGITLDMSSASPSVRAPQTIYDAVLQLAKDNFLNAITLAGTLRSCPSAIATIISMEQPEFETAFAELRELLSPHMSPHVFGPQRRVVRGAPTNIPGFEPPTGLEPVPE